MTKVKFECEKHGFLVELDINPNDLADVICPECDEERLKIEIKKITDEKKMSKPIKPILESIRRQVVNCSETSDSVNLHLTKKEFMQRMQKELDGWPLLDLLEKGEYRICERMGLCDGYIKDGVVYIDVPRWNNLVAHLRIVNSV